MYFGRKYLKKIPFEPEDKVKKGSCLQGIYWVVDIELYILIRALTPHYTRTKVLKPCGRIHVYAQTNAKAWNFVRQLYGYLHDSAFVLFYVSSNQKNAVNVNAQSADERTICQRHVRHV